MLYADDGYDSHVVKLLLAEKELSYEFGYFDDREELAELNPYSTLPIFVGRDIALYQTGVIFEFLEERYRAHRLLPISPIERARVRQLAWRLEHDWLSLGAILMTHPDNYDDIRAADAKARLSNSLITLSPLFARQEFFLSDTFGWCDVLLLPLLWRLPQIGIELPDPLCPALIDYSRRGFSRASFRHSLRSPRYEGLAP